MREFPNDIDGFLRDGFTRRMARDYLDTLEREKKSGLFDADYLAWAHSQGFCAESACAYGLNEENKGDYLTDYDYWRLWPLNGWQRIWINDKLTLNALVQDSPLERYVPRYYYYREQDRLLPLAGSGYEAGMDAFISILREVGAFACKPSNGTEASGFHRLEFEGGSFFLDGEERTRREVERFVIQSTNYVFTEFIRPEAGLAKISPLIHTIRVLVVNPTGVEPVPTIGYLRFATQGADTGTGANYHAPTNDEGAYNARIDLATGRYGDARLVFANRAEACPNHPASGTPCEGVIPGWDELQEMVRRISLKVGACEYLGFDACMTTDGPKLMEINSHSGIKYLQLFNPIMKDEVLAPYFESKLREIDGLDEKGRAARNAIIR